MGRQIGVAMTQKDEEEFLNFLASFSDIQILADRAATVDAIYLDTIPPRSPEYSSPSITLWNKEFGFYPKFTQDVKGQYYVENLYRGPVLLYTQHRFKPWLNPLQSTRPGRLYWPRSVDPDAEGYQSGNYYSYDEKAFEKWYNKVVRWVKKHGTKRDPRGPYYMPHTSRWEK